MHASISRAARQPMIRFLGQRSWPTTPHKPAPHPMAPSSVAENFSAFLKKSGAGSSASSSSVATSAYGSGLLPKSSKPYDFESFYDAPAYLWQRKELTEREIEAIMSGGATDIRTGA